MIAVDTNVLMYACDQSEPLRRRWFRQIIATSGSVELDWKPGKSQRPVGVDCAWKTPGFANGIGSTSSMIS
jgi:hypothetical protein